MAAKALAWFAIASSALGCFEKAEKASKISGQFCELSRRLYIATEENNSSGPNLFEKFLC
jgi:hypothetical protein